MNSKVSAHAPFGRRRFIRGLTTGVLTSLAARTISRASALRPGSLPARRNRLSLSSVMFAELPLEAVCERTAQLGFEAIDIWCPFGNCRHLADAAQRLGPEGLKKSLARHELALGSFTTYVTRAERVGFPAYADFIARFGGGLVVRDSSNVKFEPGQLTSAMRAFFEQLKPQIEQAGQVGAVLAIENHGKALLGTPDSIKAFVDLNPAPRHVGIALAPFHLQKIKASVEDAIRTVGTQLRFFYAWQDGEGLNQLPGHGPADFAPWLKALAQVDYTGYLNPFMHGPSTPGQITVALAQARDYLQACREKAKLA